MTVWKEIRCDWNNYDAGCVDGTDEENPQGFWPMGDLRKIAKRRKWRVIDGDDVCPYCFKAGKPE
jgi:hypothetical protein